jgi:hypothetical protein
LALSGDPREVLEFPNFSPGETKCIAEGYVAGDGDYLELLDYFNFFPTLRFFPL